LANQDEDEDGGIEIGGVASDDEEAEEEEE